MNLQYTHRINAAISITYIVANKKLTFVAALGIAIGVSIYIFMSSLSLGFVRKSNAAIFASTPHIRVFSDRRMSEPIEVGSDTGRVAMITNPRIGSQSGRIVNPEKLLALLRAQTEVTIATPELRAGITYTNGSLSLAGQVTGIALPGADRIFDIRSTIEAGRLDDLSRLPNAIILGIGIASRLNIGTGRHVRISTSNGITKEMKVTAIFRSNNAAIDNTHCYVNLQTAQQLVGESTGYVTSINVNVQDFNDAPNIARRFSSLTGYEAQDWRIANSSLIGGFKMRGILISAISAAILLVAGFGTYNILSMTISQKVNEIAILKAVGFTGRDVVKIFVLQGMLIGLMGLFAAVIVSGSAVYFTSKIYLGRETGYFPIVLDLWIFAKGIAFGSAVSFFASYLPARKAANIDPVSIFRK